MSDYTVVYFNGIKRGFSVASTLADFTIGNHEFTIRWYGVIIAIGFVLGLLACSRLCKKKNIDLDKFFDLVIWGTIFGIIGARLMYVAFSWDYYSQHLGDIWKIHDGGLAIYGCVIFALITVLVVSKIEKFNVLDGLDLAAVGLLMGQGIGRWGNFTNQEAFGTNTNLPWGMTSEKVRLYIETHQEFFAEHGLVVSPDKAVHPTFLYESIWCIIGFFLLYYLFDKHRKFHGQIILSYAVWYGAERGVVEGLRSDSLYIGSSSVRISQIISIVIAVGALIALIILLRKFKDRPVLAPYPKAAQAAAGAAAGAASAAPGASAASAQAASAEASAAAQAEPSAAEPAAEPAEPAEPSAAEPAAAKPADEAAQGENE